jgi:signal transduction histidine kinase
LTRDDRPSALVPPVARRLGLVWVAVSLPFTTAVSALVGTRDAYLLVLVVMAFGAYTTPALVAGWLAVRRAPPGDRASYRWLYAGLVGVYVIGVAMLGGLVTGWRWGTAAGAPAVVATGLCDMIGLALLIRSRSGGRALLVDVTEATAAVVAVAAPFVVLWGPAIVGAEDAWFTVPAALVALPLTWGAYWTTVGFVRLGPGRSAVELLAVGLSLVGMLNAGLQVAQGVSGFTLPAPPLIAMTCVGASLYLLIPLNVPLLAGAGLGRLPPHAQVRGGWLATTVALAGSGALLAATAVVAGERPWAVPFALVVVTVLLALLGVRQIAGVRETRRLYRQVEEASDERRRLLTRLLERSVHDRRRFARQLHEQALAAHASFTALAGTGAAGLAGVGPAGSRPLGGTVAAQASALVQGDLARHAGWLRELMLAIRPLERDRDGGERLRAPIAAFLASAYGDRRAPRLSVRVADGLSLDWATETMLLQVVQEALHNVWRHSGASAVEVAIDVAGRSTTVRVADDGVGFVPAAAAATPGLDAMRATAAVLGGTVDVVSAPGAGTVVTAHLGPDAGPAPAPPPAPPPPLRLVRNDPPG